MFGAKPKKFSESVGPTAVRRRQKRPEGGESVASGGGSGSPPPYGAWKARSCALGAGVAGARARGARRADARGAGLTEGAGWLPAPSFTPGRAPCRRPRPDEAAVACRLLSGHARVEALNPKP